MERGRARFMKVELPSGRVVELVGPPRDVERARAMEAAADTSGPLFAEARALFREQVAIVDARGGRVDVDDLALVDFHALRAIATHEEWLPEEEVEVDCVNCENVIAIRPCRAMPLGPFVERALDDPDLDWRLEEGEPHPIPPITLRSSDGPADTIVFRGVTVREAEPLHVALGNEPFVVDAAVVRAMGIVSLGDESDAAVIAKALDASLDTETFDAVARLFTELHYPPRLFGIARCSKCGARNDVDAPFDRELTWGPPPHASGGESEGEVEVTSFVKFRAFAARAEAIAKETFAEEHEPMLMLLVEGGVPLCDEGGVALLGSYLPASPGDGMSPSRPHEIAVYYRTFRAVWVEEGPYDWEDELAETLEHEYEHFLAELAGGDPMDEEERREIADEAIRIHGKSTLLKAEVGHLGSDFVGFLRRTWILWVIIIAVALLAASFGDQ